MFELCHRLTLGSMDDELECGVLSGGPFDGWRMTSPDRDLVVVDDTVYRRTGAMRDGMPVFEADPDDGVKYR